MLGEENNLMVFPNPSNGIFSINHNNNKPQTIEIFNIVGAKIYSATNNVKSKYDIDISQYPKGIYFVKVYDEDGDHTEKIVVQ